jgi:hypothetical protein
MPCLLLAPTRVSTVYPSPRASNSNSSDEPNPFAISLAVGGRGFCSARLSAAVRSLYHFRTTTAAITATAPTHPRSLSSLPLALLIPSHPSSASTFRRLSPAVLTRAILHVRSRALPTEPTAILGARQSALNSPVLSRFRCPISFGQERD